MTLGPEEAGHCDRSQTAYDDVRDAPARLAARLRSEECTADDLANAARADEEHLPPWWDVVRKTAIVVHLDMVAVVLQSHTGLLDVRRSGSREGVCCIENTCLENACIPAT